jgi:hypothetical protein
VEEFVSYSIWPLCAGVDFEHVKVDLTPVSQLKVPLPHFPLRRENEEGDLQFLVRVEQETRNIVGGYTCTKHEACIASLLNNGPCPVPISTEVLEKRRADAAAKVLAKRLKLVEKKSVGLAKVSGSCEGGSLKQPSDTGILPAKATKLSKGTIPRTVASVATVHIMSEKRILEVSAGASSAKGGERRPGSKTVPRVKSAPSTKKRIVSSIGVLVGLSSDGTKESSPDDRASEVQSKVDPRGSSAEPQARFPTISGPRPALEVSLGIATTAGVAGASICCI